MNPLPIVAAELRRNPLGVRRVVALLAVAVALGAALSAQERALRLAGEHAALRLELVVGGGDAAPWVLPPVLGTVRDLLLSLTFAFDGLLVTAVLLMIVTALSARRQSIGALRALGAPPAFVFVAVWLLGAFLMSAGVLLGLGLALALSTAMSAFASAQLGFAVEAVIGVPEVAFAGALLAAGSLFAAAPSLPLLRVSAARLLRHL